MSTRFKRTVSLAWTGEFCCSSLRGSDTYLVFVRHWPSSTHTAQNLQRKWSVQGALLPFRFYLTTYFYIFWHISIWYDKDDQGASTLCSNASCFVSTSPQRATTHSILRCVSSFMMDNPVRLVLFWHCPRWSAKYGPGTQAKLGSVNWWEWIEWKRKNDSDAKEAFADHLRYFWIGHPQPGRPERIWFESI